MESRVISNGVAVMTVDFEYLYNVSAGGTKRPEIYKEAKHYAIKKGNGAFLVIVFQDGSVSTDTPQGEHTFQSSKAAYDFHKDSFARLQGQMIGYSHLNLCYELEDYI